MRRQTLCALTVSAALMSGASAQQFVYPSKGQSPALQKKDEAECYTWGVEQTGFDPAKPPPPAPAAAAPPTTAMGTVPGAGVRGALIGAGVGAIAGDAGAGAAAGAIAARSQSRRQAQAAQQNAQKQQQAAGQTQQANFARARSACLEGRGYSIK
jgi:hypothetical protein